jgi:hypothetical protein
MIWALWSDIPLIKGWTIKSLNLTVFIKILSTVDAELLVTMVGNCIVLYTQ